MHYILLNLDPCNALITGITISILGKVNGDRERLRDWSKLTQAGSGEPCPKPDSAPKAYALDH